jgi:hypothetical protein
MSLIEIRRQVSRIIRRYPKLWSALSPINHRIRTSIQVTRMRLTYGAAYDGNWARGNDLIRSRILEGKPCGIAKIGTLEAEAVQHFLANGPGSEWSNIFAEQLYDNVGIFPKAPAYFDMFCREYIKALSDIDIAGTVGGPGEKKLLRLAGAGARFIRWHSFEPWKFPLPWSSALRGLRVVVVHPFVGSFARQYPKRREIWGAHEVLPDCDLRFVKMPLSPGLVPSADPDWFARYQSIVAEVDAQPYDVLIVGAGGISLLLVAHARRAGKIGIHTGGGTQILFGVLNKRFDRSETREMANAAWARPLPEETPETRFKVEMGCYW